FRVHVQLDHPRQDNQPQYVQCYRYPFPEYYHGQGFRVFNQFNS
ncbi:6211_t:CDS:1, partial [Racocetra fulgida]